MVYIELNSNAFRKPLEADLFEAATFEAELFEADLSKLIISKLIISRLTLSSLSRFQFKKVYRVQYTHRIINDRMENSIKGTEIWYNLR